MAFLFDQTFGGEPTEVWPRLWLGGSNVLRTDEWLLAQKITHVLTICDASLPAGVEHIRWQRHNLRDSEDEDILAVFPAAARFLHEARLSGGRVLVHCHAGISRSPTIVLAYFLSIGWADWLDDLDIMLPLLRTQRFVIHPNCGFLRQLKSFVVDGVETCRTDLALLEESVSADVHIEHLDEETVFWECHYEDAYREMEPKVYFGWGDIPDEDLTSRPREPPAPRSS